MKNLSIITIFFILLLTACNPMDDIYDGMGDTITLVSDVEYTFTKDDYALVDENLTTYLTPDFPDTIVIPAFLDGKYPALDDGSAAYVTFNYYTGDAVYYQDSVENMGANDAYVLTTADYDAMGTNSGEPGKYDNFAYNIDPDEFLPDFLNGKYPDESDGFSVIVSYKYYSNYVTSTVMSKYTLTSEVDESYTLTTEDYDSMGEESGEPGDYDNFAYYINPDNYLPDFLAGKYASSTLTDGYIVAVSYKYYSNYVTTTETDYYKYSGSSWSKLDSNVKKWTSSSSVTLPDDVTFRVLADDDYDAMGISSFGVAVPTDNYIPIFLATNYPYAQKGDKVAVLYKYSSGEETFTQAIEYTYKDGEWAATGYVTTDTQQYVRTNGKWIYVGATLYTMEAGYQTGDDYQIIVDYVIENFGESWVNHEYGDYKEGEAYYGSDSYYGNFSYEYWNSDVFSSWEDAVSEAIGKAFLPAKYPDAEVDEEFVITFEAYIDGVSYDYSVGFICTVEGSAPAFEVTSAPAAK